MLLLLMKMSNRKHTKLFFRLLVNSSRTFCSKKVLILCNYARLSKFSKNPKKVKNDLISRVLLLHLKQILSPWKNRKSVHLHYFLRCGRKTLKGQFKECKRLNFTGYKKHCIQKRMQIIAFTRINHGLNLLIESFRKHVCYNRWGTCSTKHL